MSMKTVPISKKIKRRVKIDDILFTVILTGDGVEIRKFRHRFGRKLSWKAFWQGFRNEDGQLRWTLPESFLVNSDVRRRKAF